MILPKPKNLNIHVPIPKKLKWGIAGCSSFAENTVLPAFQLFKRSKLVSVFSHDLNRAQYISNKFGAPFAFNNFDDFLKSDIDAVYISSKNSDHYWQVIKSAESGKNILCERPLALNSSQAKEMIEACKKNNVILMVNYLHRFHPLIIKTKELLDKQLLGKIVSINVTYNIDFPPSENFRFKKELSGGGVLRDIGSQVIDLLRYFGGEITEVKGFIDNVIYKSEVEDFATAILKYENGGYGLFNVSYDTKNTLMRTDILGHNGFICLESSIDKKNFSTKLTIALHGESKKVFRKKINKVTFMIRAAQKAFLKKQLPPVSGEDALRNMYIIEEIEKQCLF
ncbi:Gfo/Idh/MocA family protein [Rosettibacter firmus]|uniref:Gfo/Idh/MocA family protein n=1 Tax=Rosettibacter firmus TaxID=3111522 RepID=UPI00336BC2B9